MILPFTTLYFGLAYLVYKYKLLFVYCEPCSFDVRTTTDQLLAQTVRTRVVGKPGRWRSTGSRGLSSSSRRSCWVRRLEVSSSQPTDLLIRSLHRSQGVPSLGTHDSPAHRNRLHDVEDQRRLRSPLPLRQPLASVRGLEWRRGGHHEASPRASRHEEPDAPQPRALRPQRRGRLRRRQGAFSIRLPSQPS